MFAVVLSLLAAAVAYSSATTLWTDARSLGIRGTGFPVESKNSPYDRFPAAAQHDVTSAVWSLSRDSAGMYVQFFTDSTSISLNTTWMSSGMEMGHFPSTGVSGLDLYQWTTNATWRWVGTTKTIHYPSASNVLASNLASAPTNGTMRRFRLHLPLYNAPVSLHVGILGGHTIVADTAEYKHLPVVAYGTSILQGGVASRPGQAWTNMVARSLGSDVYNFGFSGHGLMSLNVAKYLVEIPASVYLIDCLPNMQADLITNNTEPLVNYIRARRPGVPIVLAEGTTYGTSWIVPSVASNQAAKRKALRAAYDRLVAAGVDKLTYVTGDQLFTVDGTTLRSPTVAGTHPTDLGMRAIAQVYAKVLPPLLAETNAATAPAMSHARALRLVGVETVREAAPTVHAATVVETTHVPPRNDVVYVDARTLGIGGRANFTEDSQREMYYDRLPKAADGVVRDAVWNLSRLAMGIFVGPFTTDAESIAVNYTIVGKPTSLWHMPLSATAGANMYAFDEETDVWRFAGCVYTGFEGSTLTATMISGMPQKKRRFIIYLPLRSQVVDFHVGVPSGASIAADGPFSPGKLPIVWYGTSILSAAAGRSGMNHPTITQRQIGREVYNFGFPGNGKMELSVARFLRQIPNAGSFVIDCNPNMNGDSIGNNATPLVHYLRQNFATAPIFMVEGTTYGDDWCSDDQRKGQEAKRSALRADFDALSKTDKNLYYVTGDQLWGTLMSVDGINPTVGGTHPSDLGGQAIADYYTGYLPTILK